MSVHGMNEPGTYVITTDRDDETTVEADSLDYNSPDGSLQVWKDGAVVASFRWWQSIVRKSD
ncbi:hypothetical protein [Ornithinimicrobium cerasi]|uniref:hypothetical protein n=1 Tax=Ornithinimicrobium cerasi TaxID=2248773 RepID=UPI000EFEA1D6|nr:hypothetical protein [Ornithinimicrobium cerasi]